MWLRNRATARDCLFLLGLVGTSVVLYTSGLGFYSDDWAFLRILETTDQRSFGGLVQALYDADAVVRQRPVQVVYLACLYFVFGLQPLGYHIVNAVALAGSAALFYLVLREVNQPRRLALAVAAVYGLMPNYSSDRFWIAAHQATLSILFLLLSTLAALRSLRASPRYAAPLILASVTALLLSGLAYEVTLPLFLVVLGIVGYRARRTGFLRSRVPDRAVILLGANLLALCAVVAFKAGRSVRVGVSEGYGDYLRDIVVGILRVDLGVYGIGLPYVISWIVRHVPEPDVLALGIVVAAAVAAYLYREHLDERFEMRTSGVRYLAAGFIAMVLGYSIFLVPTVVSLSSASLGNRIRIAAALGTAAVLIGSVTLITSFVRDEKRRRTVFASGVGLLCGAFFVITNTLAGFWVSAYDAQRQIVARLQMDLPELAPGSVIIIDGVCLERGGAYVFTGRRDVAGVLAIRYRQPMLKASAITTPPQILDTGISVRNFGAPIFFPYGETLILYNPARRRVVRLVDREHAERYFERSGFRPEDCPPGFAWRGEPPPQTDQLDGPSASRGRQARSFASARSG
jgi:hypothetical protein